MRHSVRLHTVTVGHSELEHVDVEVRRAWGAFRPGLGYDMVQPIFALFSKAVSRDGGTKDAELLDRYQNARDALNLQLVDGDGRPIGTTAIHIADYSDAGGGIELDVLISDETYWKRRMKERSRPV
jgi:hypothetical protein